ncbi:hypothetical protein EE612_055167 [Oryza sativa]|nr:hypothetical protein EE612_055167 [Oryza sativa]
MASLEMAESHAGHPAATCSPRVLYAKLPPMAHLGMRVHVRQPTSTTTPLPLHQRTCGGDGRLLTLLVSLRLRRSIRSLLVHLRNSNSRRRRREAFAAGLRWRGGRASSPWRHRRRVSMRLRRGEACGGGGMVAKFILYRFNI